MEFEAEHLWNEYFQYMLIQNVLQAKKVQQLWTPQVLVGCQYEAVSVEQTCTAVYTLQIWEDLCWTVLTEMIARNTAGKPLTSTATASFVEYIREEIKLKNQRKSKKFTMTKELKEILENIGLGTFQRSQG